MWYRCLNDVFGYCKGEPETDRPLPKSQDARVLMGATCKLDKATCGRYSTTHCSKETDNGRES